MTEIHHVVLVPTPDGDSPDPRGLLTVGPFGASPPVAFRHTDSVWRDSPHREREMYKAVGRALVVAWDKRVLPLGVFYTDEPNVTGWLQWILDGHMSADDWAFFHEEWDGLGRFVFLDDQRNEVTP